MKILATLFTILLFAEHVHCQDSQNPPIEYRIIARKNSNPEIESVSNTLELYLPMKIFLPTAFTPNGDGLNDSFGPIGEGIDQYKLVIFNRWGQVIFQTSNIDQKWDGYQNGRKVPNGEYSYQLLAYGKEFGEVFKTGNVLVVD
jgi:gliding motility-associated-like protein